MKNLKILIAGIAAAAVITFGALTFMTKEDNSTSNKPGIEDSENNSGATFGDVVVNIEGKIVEVAEDGKSFKLDNGLWVEITEDTQFGTGLPTESKDSTYREKTFRVGNSIAGYTEGDTSTGRVKAYAIYTNWNWDDPISKEENQPIMACVMVNIEGKIIEIAEDGKSFKLDTGLWVEITDKTEFGANTPTSSGDSYIEETFRVGNSIAGFTEGDTSTGRVTAYAIYTNWNWDNPVR